MESTPCSLVKNENTNYKITQKHRKVHFTLLIKGCLHEQSKKQAEIKFS